MYLVSSSCRSFQNIQPQAAAYASFQYNARGFLRQPGFAAAYPDAYPAQSITVHTLCNCEL